MDTLYIVTMADWTLEGLIPDWLLPDKFSGSGTDTILFQTILPNEGNISREVVLYLFSSLADPVEFTVIQKGKTSSVGEPVRGYARIYPNPSHGRIRISSTRPIDRIELISSRGEFIDEFFPDSGEFILDLPETVKGLYFLVIHGKDWVLSKKIILN